MSAFCYVQDVYHTKTVANSNSFTACTNCMFQIKYKFWKCLVLKVYFQGSHASQRIAVEPHVKISLEHSHLEISNLVFEVREPLLSFYIIQSSRKTNQLKCLQTYVCLPLMHFLFTIAWASGLFFWWKENFAASFLKLNPLLPRQKMKKTLSVASIVEQ